MGPPGTDPHRARLLPFGADQWFALARWLYGRAWIGSERPTLLFDLVTARLVQRKILLPGVTTLERLIAGVRERAEQRLWATLTAAPSPQQTKRIQQLVAAESVPVLGVLLRG